MALRKFPWLAERVSRANDMASLAAEECIKAVQDGRYLTLENPGQSWMWQLPLLLRLASLPGVQWFTYHSCAFGGDRRKYQGILTNVPGWKERCSLECGAREEDAPCEFSGQVHASWRPVKEGEGRPELPTQLEAEYPRKLAQALAGPMAELVKQVPEKAAGLAFAFVEVLSSLNAPLTVAVREAFRCIGAHPQRRRCRGAGAGVLAAGFL